MSPNSSTWSPMRAPCLSLSPSLSLGNPGTLLFANQPNILPLLAGPLWTELVLIFTEATTRQLLSLSLFLFLLQLQHWTLIPGLLPLVPLNWLHSIKYTQTFSTSLHPTPPPPSLSVCAPQIPSPVCLLSLIPSYPSPRHLLPLFLWV